ncbi:MAG: tRNA uridine-5-carboxymethylaminomethyl(34) synthesis GTPase MnmE [Firmicutes bacterium]|nr:tRNA uridine-5-carboxymethylaminomethyl(34) synthesis GTPase MnmE [Bacillota bacterium]
MSTIVAISTSPGIGGIGIIRMSGKDTFEILNKIFKPKNDTEIKGYTMKYGNIIDNENNKIIDEVLVSYFISPKSYTTENMCEINSHGGVIVMKQILDLCLKNGAELAEAGEFTKRAFLNGRIDLIKAEAIIDIINAKTEKEKDASVSQLNGFLSKEISNIEKELLSFTADIEANIDYPEYDIEQVSVNKSLDTLNSVKNKLLKLKESFNNGKILKEGINTAIIGRPNVGKSSLLNVLLKEERAIVTEFEGTTRDTIEEYINIKGIPLKIIDTAGIRETDNAVEKIGIEKSIEIAKSADLIIAIFDISQDLKDDDRRILELIANKNAIIVLNKIDLTVNKTTESAINELNKEIVKISALERQGIDDIYEKIVKLYDLNKINIEGENIVTNSRHQYLINQSLNSLEKALETVNSGLPLDIIAIDVRDILMNLGKITGKNVSEDVINEIFSKFCLGK